MNKYFKWIIAAIIIALGVFLIINENYFWGITLIVLSAIPIFLFFRNEYIWLAFWQLRKQNLEGAQKWLSKITNINTQLVRKQFGYFHYLQGLTLGNNNVNLSEQLMRKALDYGLTFDHDRAMATLNLAAASMARGKKQEAERLLNEAKKLDKQNMLAEHIKMMKEQMKKINIGKNMQNPNIRQRGKFF